MVDNEMSIIVGARVQPFLRALIGSEGSDPRREIPVETIEVDGGVVRGSEKELEMLSHTIGSLMDVKDKIDTKLEHGVSKRTLVEDLNKLQKDINKRNINLPSDDDVDWVLDKTKEML